MNIFNRRARHWQERAIAAERALDYAARLTDVRRDGAAIYFTFERNGVTTVVEAIASWDTVTEGLL